MAYDNISNSFNNVLLSYIIFVDGDMDNKVTMTTYGPFTVANKMRSYKSLLLGYIFANELLDE